MTPSAALEQFYLQPVDWKGVFFVNFTLIMDINFLWFALRYLSNITEDSDLSCH